MYINLCTTITLLTGINFYFYSFFNDISFISFFRLIQSLILLAHHSDYTRLLQYIPLAPVELIGSVIQDVEADTSLCKFFGSEPFTNGSVGNPGQNRFASQFDEPLLFECGDGNRILGRLRVFERRSSTST